MAEVTRLDRLRGAVYGLAYGDAWGYPTEFQTYEQLRANPADFPRNALISDDTQMSLYVTAAVLADMQDPKGDLAAFSTNPRTEYLDELRVKIAQHLLVWRVDPDNNRAPGQTCLKSLDRIKNRPLITGLEGTDDWSKGNGANIRCPWLGLLAPNLSDDIIALLAVVQASVTHNNPIALAASAVTSLTIAHLYQGGLVPGRGRVYADLVNSTNFLIASRYTDLLPEAYRVGLEELHFYLTAYNTQAAIQATLDASPAANICQHIGDAWVAEEALLLSAVATDMTATVKPLDVMKRIANASGDTDSIGAIAGSFIGVAYGEDIFPEDWEDRLEPRYQADIAETLDLIEDITF